MNKIFLIFIILLISSVSNAHRLNEYLQATTISLSRDQLRLELRLTPGTDVADKLIKVIDLNGDLHFSTNEQQVYLLAVTRDLSLKIDGRVTMLKLTGASFPTVEDLHKGIGDIIIDYKVPLDSKAASHRVTLNNHHYSTIAVYLVNCLLPADTAIRVTGQTRGADQSFYQLDFSSDQNAKQAVDGDSWPTVKTYFIHGIKHILTGYDHLLFLCALVLGATGLWNLIKIVTAFTIAHSVTLALATFGLAHLPEQVVEPIIAASIVFVAVQNIAWPKQANGNSRLAIAFIFGLFHGLGFAGGLLQIMHAMPANLIWFALLGFSLGVEAGNQLVLLPLYTCIRFFKSKDTSSLDLYPNLRSYASAAVALAGLGYLFVDIYTIF